MITVVYQPQTTIVAHRGFMEKGVENSLGSLRAAAEVGADMVEMDIQETKDGQFVVMHDYNLKRLAGLDQEVRNMTLKELQTVKIVQNGFTDRIPSLKEYIDEAKSLNMKLLIEVKPHGYESEDMCDNLIKVLKDKQVLSWFSVQSLDKPILDELKIKEPRLKTGYIIPLNFGHLPDTLHNFYVLEEFSVTENLLEEAKELKKGLFVWTVNKDELLKHYLRLDVDGIISNHPDRGVEFRESREETETFLNRVLFLLEK
ncbi:glycerophosphodiester phosphodiesterase [Vagococcus intermedius]|uniref:Glycerophosphodiester phosphodiesterase n=1 Tax=Vagococcus intermedius TaxID=2991418 RepID=A0AAF0I4Z9_9ENTE|nr:glycerophosphodiester phosphodiesterase [Vagococcus intermedius]WEG72658.1 glycerophosphodiester phosphodiesterase [Vagococcus intermedius]WEG74743.1 glycerophosphodiester phosphodiesterase [Vagococcus intermedius]